ncbi:MAG: YesL family protein [Lachnospiraceae bacterium]|nr:YesL family protein [Lachnospiraceae bacterium]
MLDGVFNMDNPFFRFVNRIADMIVLNVIFLVSCVPIFTIGPALTALYYVAINTWGREDGYIFKMYIKSFKENFKQSTVMWLILLAVGVVLSVDVWYWVSQWKLTGTGIYKPLTVVSVVMLMVYLMIFTFVWPLLAKFSNSNLGTIKNALAMVLTHVPETILIWAIFALVAFAVYIVSFARIAVFFIGISLIAYLQALVFRHIFKPYLGEEEHKTPEEEAGLVGYDNAYADSKIEVAKLAEEMARKEEAKQEEPVVAAQEQPGKEMTEQVEDDVRENVGNIAEMAGADEPQEESAAEKEPEKPAGRRSIADIIAATSNPEEE